LAISLRTTVAIVVITAACGSDPEPSRSDARTVAPDGSLSFRPISDGSDAFPLVDWPDASTDAAPNTDMDGGVVDAGLHKQCTSADRTDPACATCFDGKKNRDESDLDCGGHCPLCRIGMQCRETDDCVSPYVCNANNRCMGASGCAALHQQRPDLPSDTYTLVCGTTVVSAQCDMSTQGGGWTEITLATARNKLGGQMTAIVVAPEAGFDSEDRPFTRDAEGGHLYHYTFSFPCGFSEFMLTGYQIRANSPLEPPGHSSELGAASVHVVWNEADVGDPGVGDISFGSAADSGPVTSFGRLQEVGCVQCTLSWPAPNSIYRIKATSSTAFRIAWSEGGTQFEGWYPWWGGTIKLR